MVELTFLTRVDCHLCALARETVAEVAAGRDVRVTEVDIDTDDDLAAQYGWDVPVVLLNGRQHRLHRVEGDRLSQALASLGARERWKECDGWVGEILSANRIEGVVRRTVPERVISRLPIYLQAVETIVATGRETVSSEDLAAASGVSLSILRKDLSQLGR